MKITEDTKISVLLKENSGSIDAIASLAKPLEKLRNPVLRKVMASRVTIAGASKISGVPIADFIKVLTPLGFEFEASGGGKVETKEQEESLWLKNATPDLIENMDVRELLSQGNDPFKQIMERYRNLAAGHILCIISPFEPIPLIQLLNKQGAQSYVRLISGQEYHTFFLKPGKPGGDKAPDTASAMVMVSEEEFNAVLSTFGPAHTDIDVKELEMPAPMHKILDALSVLKDDSVLQVFHKRIPVYLLEALAGKDYKVYVCNKAEGDVRLLITKTHHG